MRLSGKSEVCLLITVTAVLILPHRIWLEPGLHAADDGSLSMKRTKEDFCAMTDEELKKVITPEQFEITRRNGTERPFANAYWNNKKPGLYVDVISGEPLFASVDKFDSGTGWPSFSKPMADGAVTVRRDSSHGLIRSEVRSSKSDAHLGHVFEDGPGPDGLRYCINSAALRFIPLERLTEEGYGRYLDLFAETDELE